MGKLLVSKWVSVKLGSQKEMNEIFAHCYLTKAPSQSKKNYLVSQAFQLPYYPSAERFVAPKDILETTLCVFDFKSSLLR